MMKFHSTRKTLAIYAASLLLVNTSSFAVSYTVNSNADTNTGTGTSGTLRYVLTQLNSSGTSGSAASNNSIAINSDVTSIQLTSNLPVIQKGVTITQAGGTATTISGASSSVATYRIFATFQSSLSLSNLVLDRGLAKGGAPSNAVTGAGGGGLGAGGGVYVDVGQSLSLANVTISNCIAQGGKGGDGNTSSAGGVGGGGASFSVSSSNNTTGIIGGGDRGGNASGTYGAGGASITGVPSSGGFGGGNGGGSGAGAGGGNGAGGNTTLTLNGSAGAGGYCGGGGGHGTPTPNSTYSAAGGGNGGGTAPTNSTLGSGGGGGFGSGGGAGGIIGSGGGGGYGGGGGGSQSGGGGGGGFGGGGGGGTISAANGGYAGGKGGINATTAGGVGNAGGGGGGGAGIGGGVFVAQNGIFQIGNGTSISNCSSVGGAAGTSASGSVASPAAGSGIASGIFLFVGAQAQFVGSADITVPWSISDTSNATGTAPTDSGVLINKSGGTGTVTFTSTSNKYVGTTTVQSGALSVSGSNLPAGNVVSISSGGTLNATGGTFTGAITNAGTLNISDSSTLSSGSNTNTGTITVSSGTNVVNMTNSGIFNIAGGATLDSSSVFTNNSGAQMYVYGTSSSSPVVINANILSGTSGSKILSVGRNSALTSFANTVFTTSSTISGITAITVYAGTFTINSTINNLTSITNNSGATTYFTAAYSNGNTTLSNAGTLNIAAATTFGSVTNTAAPIYVYSSGSIAGNITATGASSLSVGRDSSGNNYSATAYTTNGIISGIPTINVRAGTFNAASAISGVSTGLTIDSGATANFTGVYSGSGAISNSGTLTIGNTFGSGAITNASGATLKFLTNTANSSVITNQSGGTFSVEGASTTSANITNQGTMSITAQITGAGALSNSGTLTLGSGANVGLAITNTGNLNVIAAINASNTITNNNQMSIAGNINMSGNTLTGNGTVTVSGQQSLTATSYVNSGTHITTITDATTFDQLTCSGTVNLAGATLQVNSSFQGVSGQTSTTTWEVLKGSSITSAASVVLPSSSLFSSWSATNTGSSYVITLVKSDFERIAPSGVDQEIATILDGFFNDPQNAAQQQLSDLVFNTSTQAEFESALNQLIPNVNASTPLIQMQNIITSKIESRIASLNAQHYRNLPTYGYTAGDMNCNSAFWIAPFGSIAKQTPDEEDAGYRATSSGIVLGIDKQTDKLGLLGFGIGYSNTYVNENSNTGFNTQVLGTHALVYSSTRMKCNRFVELLATGAYNRNKGSRQVNINGTNLSVNSNYHSWQIGGKANLGKIYNPYDYFQFSPIITTIYSFIHQPSYSETGSSAALNVSTRTNQSVWSLGGGAQIALPCDKWWMLGTQQLRATVTYDIISANQVIAASFVAGGSDFSISDNPARVALRLGLDMAMMLINRLQLQLSFDYELRQKYTDYSGMLKFKWLF